ncbi:MAG: glycosyltransferase [Paracoccaceae bacterium]
MAPLISVIIPAFRAGETVARAVRSVMAAGVPEDRLEILVESDDGTDYAGAAALSPAVRVGVSGAVGSGVGPARNRAMARARGEWLTFLDADDAFSPGYLSALLPLAQGHGAAAAPLRVVEGGQTILDLWSRQSWLGLADLAATGASVRLMLARDGCPPFADALSQDILHAVQVIAGLGGSVPLSGVPYLLNLHPQSVTAADDFSARVHSAYQDHVAQLDRIGQPAAADVFRAKIALNAAYEQQGRGRSYYRFIADTLR